MAACLVSCTAAPDLPAAAPTDAYAEAMLALHPVGYWRLDEHDTDVMLDATSTTNGGYHGGPRLGDPGFNESSAHFDGNAQYGEIADRAAFSLTRAWDDFDRISLGTWGGAWSGTNGNVINGLAWIDPYGHTGTFEQAMDVRLAHGNLQVRTAIDHAAIALVAERADQTFVRAELRDTGDAVELHLIATESGVDTDLASSTVGDPGGWWYLRFEFDGTALQARAWQDDEPTTWLQATAASATEGTIAIRTTTSSLALVQDFRAQTLGLSVHVAVRLDAEPTDSVEQILGKGNHSGFFSSTDQEFHMRIDRDDDGLLLKGYAFDREGGYGAGQAFAITPARWYDVVLEFDPGDYHDASAGVSMYVDGVALPNGGGSRYRSSPCIPSHEICWSIDPRSGDAPLRIGTSDGSSFFVGNIDELALFDRLLTADEVTSLRR